MATTMQTRKPMAATPARWQAALRRAFEEGVQVRQLADSGAWIATSGTDAAIAYEVEVVAGLAHRCACPAGASGDPVCKHRALVHFRHGLLDPEPPTPAAPALVPAMDARDAEAESAYYRRLDAAEAYAAFIEQQAAELGDEPADDWTLDGLAA